MADLSASPSKPHERDVDGQDEWIIDGFGCAASAAMS
jgi:hypothetical protein